MSSYHSHLIQARHNEELVQLLGPDSGEFPDWVITATFYSALHYLEAGFSRNYRILHSHSHRTRQRLLNSNYSQQAYQSYRNLYDASIVSRYLYNPDTRQDILSGYLHYTTQEVEDFYHLDLDNIRREFRFQNPYP